MAKPKEITGFPEFEGLDAYRLVVAVHELAHYLIFKNAGIEVPEVWVKGRGYSGAYGFTGLPKMWYEPHQKTALLVGTLAGREADLKFCDQVGIPPLPSSMCWSDMSSYSRDRRAMRISTWKSTHRAEARRQLTIHWPQILRLAPTLARRGRLPL